MENTTNYRRTVCIYSHICHGDNVCDDLPVVFQTAGWPLDKHKNLP